MVHARSGVHSNVNVFGLHVTNIRKWNLHTSPRGCQKHRSLSVIEVAYCAIKDRQKLSFVCGFNEIVESWNIKAITEIFIVSRDENNLYRRIFFPNRFGKLHAIHFGHFNVKKQNVKVFFLRVIEKKRLSRGIAFHFNNVTVFARPIWYYTR